MGAAEALPLAVSLRMLLENDMAMLTHFGLKLSFVRLYTTEIPLKLYEQSVIFVVKKTGNYLYVPTNK